MKSKNFVLWTGLFLWLAVNLAQAESDFSKETAQSGPTWLRDGVIYEVFPRSFSPDGNLNGVTARLDELKDLGVTIVWLMPIHPIGEKFRKGNLGSPYSIRDYYAIDPNYGTPDDFKMLVKAAHARGMKVIMDLVANHTAWDSVMMAHPEFYNHDSNGKIIPPVPDWADVAGLNYANPELREYMIAMLKHYVTEFNVDGFRCDAASMVPVAFWEQARAELKKIQPDIGLLAEASEPKLLVKAFDIDYSWPLRSTLDDVLINGAPASNLRATWEENLRRFPIDSLHMRVSDDHDEARAIAKYGIHGALAASALMFSLDGVPLLYNGMEVGDATESGAPALFDKLPIFWDPKERPPLRNIYRDLAKLRKQSPAFRNNRLVWLKNTDEKNVVTFLREDEREQFVVVINLSNRPANAGIEIPNSTEFQAVKIAGMSGPRASDFPSLHLGSFEWRIYRRAIPGVSSASAKPDSVR